MHWAPACGQRALHPLRVAGPLHGTPCSRMQRAGSTGAMSWMRLKALITFTLRIRGHSSQTVELPAPMNGAEQALELFAGAVTERTKVLAFSHVQYADA